MDAKELLEAAKKRADYDASSIALLEAGRDAQKKHVMSLQGQDRANAYAALNMLKTIAELYPGISEAVITLVAFEIQVENAKFRSTQRNN